MLVTSKTTVFCLSHKFSFHSAYVCNKLKVLTTNFFFLVLFFQFLVFSSMAFTKNKVMMQIFATNVRNLWEKWELRFMVLSSFIFQNILIILGNKRQQFTKCWLRITLSFSYMLSDWLATISLGVLSNKLVGDNIEEKCDDFVDPKYVIVSLQAPILLIHLPYTDAS